MRHRAHLPQGLDTLTVGRLIIDIAAHKVTREGEDVRLTRKEFAVLTELARYPGRVITHTQLLRSVWGTAHVDDVEYLRVAVRGLRLKLEDDPAVPALLRNEPGVGYRLDVS